MPERPDTRAAIVEAAARLLHENGPAAVTTRGVAEAAGVQAPAIYRAFGDKDGLLEAVAEHVVARFVDTKAATVAAATAENIDPVEELRDGWDTQIAFNLGHPALFRWLSDPQRVAHSAAVRAGLEVLRARVHRIAAAGRLRVDEDRAVAMIQAAGTGAVTMLLATAPEQRDPGLADAMFEAVLTQIVVDAPSATADPVRTAALGLRAAVPALAFTDAEGLLLAEWLDRVIGHRSDGERIRPGT